MQELLDEADQLPLKFTIFNTVSVSESPFSHVQARDDTFSTKKRWNANQFVNLNRIIPSN
jgi:hypothetical protein